MISKMTFAIAVSLAFLRLWATDGVLSSSQLDSGAKPYRYGNAIRWDGGVVAGDGGFATIRMNRSHDTLFYQDVKGLTLCGLDFANSMFTMVDNDITLTGERPVLTGGSYGGDNGRPLTFAVAFKGTGGGTLVKKGKAKFNFAVPVDNFALFSFIDGEIVATNDSGRIVANVPIEFSKRIDVFPNTAESGHAELTLGNGALTVLGDAAAIRIDRGGNDMLTLNLGPLVMTSGSTLAFTLVNGISELGGNVKIKCAEPPASATDGKIDCRIIARDSSVEHNPLTFLTYDAEKGFVPASGEKFARISESGDVTASTNVPALVIDNHSSVTNGNGVVITVGDGINPAAVILNSKANASGYPQLRGGAIDFGTSRGIIYKSAAAGTGTDITSELRGQNGISFVAKQDLQLSPYVRFYQTDAKWTGPTHISGLRYWLDGGSKVARPFPDGGDVYVTGGRAERSGQIYIYEKYNDTHHDSKFFPAFNQHFFVSGYGCQSGDQDGALFFVSSHSIFNGPFTLEGDTLFNIYEKDILNKSVIEFNAPMDGAGNLEIRTTKPDLSGGSYLGSSVTLNALNTFRGDFTAGPGFTLNLNTNGTFGAGAVVLKDIDFKVLGGGDHVITNMVTGSGRMEIGEFASAAFTSDAAFASVKLNYDSFLEIGGKMEAGEISAFPGSAVRAAGEGARLCVTGGVVSGAFEGGRDHRLELVKRGAGELVFGGGTEGISSFKVEEGTVKVCRILEDFDSIEYWLDAADPDTITFDGNGNAVKWGSKAGKEVNFTVPSGYFAPKYITGALNGNNAFLFTNGVYQVDEKTFKAKDTTRFTAERALVQKTVFIVNKPVSCHSRATPFWGLFGKTGADYGIRMDYGNCWHVPTNGNSGIYYPMLKNIYLDGVKKNAQNDKVYWTIDRTQIAAFFHPYEGVGGHTFIPSVGGYRTDRIYSGGENGGSIFAVDFNGYIAEVIAFNRMLSDSEIKEVSDYLGKKWKGTDYTCVSSQRHRLAFDGKFELFGQGRLDLNGSSIQLAELSGQGEIINTSDCPATLIVTGRCDFAGKVGEGISFSAKQGTMAVDPSVPTDITVGGDNLELSPYNYSVPTQGLCYWLDASLTSTLTFDDNGCVTNWQSRADGCSVSKFYWAADKVTSDKVQSGWIFDPPEYSATGLNGKPAIKSKSANHAAQGDVYEKGSALVADAKTNTRTLFMVGNVVSHTWYSSGIFGLYAEDTGFRFNNPQGVGKNNDISVAYNGCSYMRLGDVFRLNGADGYGGITGASKQFVMGEAFVLTAMINGGYDRTGYNSFPGYFINRSPEMLVSEVIAYDRVLSDEEIYEIERYLTAKWIENDGEIPPRNDAVLAYGSTITVAAENGEVGKLTIDGDLDLDSVSFSLVDTKELATADKRTVVEVSGDLTGTIGEIARDNAGSWKLAVDDGKIDIFKPGFFLLMR